MSLLCRLLLGDHAKRWASGQVVRSYLSTFSVTVVDPSYLARCAVGTGVFCFHWSCNRDLEEETWFSFIFSKSKKMQTIFSGWNSIHSSDFLSDDNLLLSSLPCLCSWTLSVLFHENLFLNHCFLVLRVSWLLLEQCLLPTSVVGSPPCVVSMLLFLLASWPVAEGTAWPHLCFYPLDVKRSQIILWSSNVELLQSLSFSAVGASLNPSLPLSEACS